jgi:HlyD family secretion protein
LVPVGALLRKGDSWIVLVAEDDGRAHERRITIGARTDGEAAVVSGLSAGEKVILYPSDRVKEDVRIVDRFKQ